MFGILHRMWERLDTLWVLLIMAVLTAVVGVILYVLD